jgi:nucleoside-diphosphate-sugar epimerase
MRILVLGGTRFLGRALVDQAVGRGYDVTTFSRGHSGHPRPGVEALHGDRTSEGDLRLLAGREWDAVIDTSVLAPVHVAASARLLAESVRHYTYISSASVYAAWPQQAASEESPILDCQADAAGTVEALGYGELKAGAEGAVGESFPGRHLIVRPGLIVGPYENVGRLPWWLTRLAKGGEILAPGEPGRPLRVTDVRDLASWVIDNTRRAIPGVMNVPGPQGVTISDLLTIGEQVTEADRATRPTVRWVADTVLLAAGVNPWMELPMWAPDTPDFAGIWRISGDRAARTGINYRSLAETAHDTWLWLKQQAAATGRNVLDFEFARRPGIGMDPGREQEILSSL